MKPNTPARFLCRDWLFASTSVGFVISALFVFSVILSLPPAKPQTGSVYARTTRGIRAYLKTPRLKGLLAITFAAAAASSMVIVNTVVIVREMLGLGQREVALTLAAYGGYPQPISRLCRACGGCRLRHNCGSPAATGSRHRDCAADHPHMREEHKGGQSAAHAFVIDDLHPQWPRN